MKKLIAILLTLLMTLSLASCGDNADTNDKTEDADTTIQSVDDQEEQTNEEINEDNAEQQEQEEKVGYDSDWLEYDCGARDFGDNFGKFINDYNQVLGTDGMIYDVSDPESHWFAGNDDVQEIVKIGVTYGYKDSKGFIHIEGFLCSGIKGEIFYGFKDMFGGKYVIFSMDTDGKMYVNAFDKAGLKEDGYDNAPLWIENSDTDVCYDKVDKIEVVKIDRAGNAKFYIEVGGERFYDNFTSMFRYQDGYKFLLFTKVSSEADKILDYGYATYSPIYSKVGDQTTLYYKNFSTELPIFLPDGYTAADIKKVNFNETTVIMFNDGAVYMAELVHNIAGPTLVKDERISELAKDGKLLDCYCRDSGSEYEPDTKILVMDDNCIYSVATEEK